MEADQIDFSYPDGTRALQGIDMKIPGGQFTALLGANGSGKTTLFKVLTGLLKPARGQVRVDGRPFGDYSREELYRRIGFVFQDPNDQLFAPTVGEDVAFGPANLGFDARETAGRVQEALALVGLAEQSQKPIHFLSFGQKKRAAVAGVLAMQPEVIILDEPTAGLDPAGSRDILKLLVRLNKEEGITILMATHDVDLVPLVADKVFILHRGRLLLSGTPGDVFAAKDTVRGAGLRLPRVAHLGEILAHKDHLAVDRLPLTIGEARRMILDAVHAEGGHHD